MRTLSAWLREILWPHGAACLCCSINSEGELLCPICKQGLEAMRLPADIHVDQGIYSAYRYEGIVRQLVYLLKMDCQTDAAEVLAEEMTGILEKMNVPSNTVLTWVTMPEIRKLKRGVDHGRALCEAVSAKSGLPAEQLLVRTGNGHTQRGLNREQRLKNIANSIDCRKKIDVPVVVIDDVLTTGATVNVCMQALRRAGATQVYALTASKVVLDKNLGF